MADENAEWPKEERISEDVIALVGFKDDRMEIKVNTHIILVGWVTLPIAAADKPKILKAFGIHDEWMRLPPFMRQHVGAK